MSRPAGKMNRIRLFAVLGSVAAVTVGAIALRQRLAPQTVSETFVPQFVVCDAALVERGTVDAAETVPIMMGADGDILELLPSGTKVEAGTPILRVDDADIVARIDEDDLNIQLEEIETTVRTSRRVQVEIEQKSRLATAAARLRLAKLEGESLRAGLSAADQRLLEIELRQTELDWLDASEELERQRRMRERGFIAEVVLDRYVRREETARAALEEKKLQLGLRTQGARAEDLVENERSVDRYTADLARGESAMKRRLAQIDAGIAVGALKLEQRRFDRERNAEDVQRTTTVAATNGVLRVRMYSNWRQGGSWLPYSAGIRKSKHDTVGDIIGHGSYRVDLMVHESDVHRVKVNAPVRIRVGAFPGRVFWGKVYTVGGVGRDRQDVAPRGYEDSPSGVTMFNVTVRFEDVGDAVLHPGMSAIAEIVVEPVERRLLIPLAAVGSTTNGPTVLLAAGTPRARPARRPVQGRPFDALHFAVEDGLCEGEEILARWANE